RYRSRSAIQCRVGFSYLISRFCERLPEAVRAPQRPQRFDPPYAASAGRCPNKPRGVPRIDDRRVLNGIFWVLRTGAPWRALPKEFGPRTTCYKPLRVVGTEVRFIIRFSLQKGRA